MTFPKNNLPIQLSKQFTPLTETCAPIYWLSKFSMKFCLNRKTHTQTNKQIQHFLNFIIKYVPTDCALDLFSLTPEREQRSQLNQQ